MVLGFFEGFGYGFLSATSNVFIIFTERGMDGLWLRAILISMMRQKVDINPLDGQAG